MEIIRTVKELDKYLEQKRRQGSVGLVPTMGALHAGHMALVERARGENSTLVVSLFVNPTQFNDPQDLKNYPRTEEADFRMLTEAGCDAVFAPSVEEMYPEPDTRQFDFGQLDQVMEGAHRPGHFNGVAQIVSKLLEAIRPDRAYFGEKDFQQLAVIRSMVRQLEVPVEIMGCPTVRAQDGLALSSRNLLLPPHHRAMAPLIYDTLQKAVGKSHTMAPQQVVDWVRERLSANGQMEPEYFDIVHAETLQSITTWDEPGPKQGCVAVRLGEIRLIDNIKFR